MQRHLRSLLLFPMIAVLLVAAPALLLSWFATPGAALGQTVPPPVTVEPPVEPPPATATSPAPRPTERPTVDPTVIAPTIIAPTQPPVQPLPTATLRPAAQPTARPGADGRVRIGGVVVQRVTGDRRSATAYGLTQQGALYRSDDNGLYWDLVTADPELSDFLFSPADPSILYSSLPIVCGSDPVGSPVAISDNGGVSWRVVETPAPLEPLWASSDDDLVAIASACDGLYRTNDAGASWQQLTPAGDPLWLQSRAVQIEEVEGDLYALLQSEVGASFVALSSDDGASWSVISPVGMEQPFRATALAVDPSQPGRLWAAGEQGVWVTEDQGQFWGLSAGGLEDVIGREGAAIHDVAWHPRDLLFVATEGGFYSKPATERTWERLGVETVGLRIESLLLTESSPRRLWLNSEIGVYRYLIR
jgi:photosystem II stability/assembly factor-like uncharacterized protein